MTAAPDHRRSMLAKLHIAKQDLCLDDATYRAVLKRVAGLASAKDASERQLGALIEEMKRLGWSDKPATAMRQGRSAGGRMIRGLWKEVSREKSETSLRAMIRRVLGLPENVAADPDMLATADRGRVIEALKAMKKRAGAAPAS